LLDIQGDRPIARRKSNKKLCLPCVSDRSEER
jgi:hypothetical protein